MDIISKRIKTLNNAFILSIVMIVLGTGVAIYYTVTSKSFVFALIFVLAYLYSFRSTLSLKRESNYVKNNLLEKFVAAEKSENLVKTKIIFTSIKLEKNTLVAIDIDNRNYNLEKLNELGLETSLENLETNTRDSGIISLEKARFIDGYAFIYIPAYTYKRMKNSQLQYIDKDNTFLVY